jgi:protein-disulfide isomerase
MSEVTTEKPKSSDKTWYVIGAVVIIGVILLFTNGFGLWGGGGKTNPSALSIGNSPVLGNDSAPVTLYLFSDFSCPYCAAAEGYNQPVINSLKSGDPSWEPPIPNIIKDYVETGKAKLIFKYSPGHGTGQPAHRVGWCLNEQGLFWKFQDLAFANQQDTDDLNKMKILAQTTGANMTQLNSCLDSGRVDTYFARDTSMAQSAGVLGTPAIFINGQLEEGAQSFIVYQKIIDKELNK